MWPKQWFDGWSEWRAWKRILDTNTELARRMTAEGQGQYANRHYALASMAAAQMGRLEKELGGIAPADGDVYPADDYSDVDEGECESISPEPFDMNDYPYSGA